jgi:hypothetical protein
VVTSLPGGDELPAWCEQWLGAKPVDVIFASGHLSKVYGVRLADTREVVVKIRPASPRIGGCVEVQRHLWESGFPCPQPLAGPASFGPDTATAEEYVPGGAFLERGEESTIRFAELLWQLIERCAHLNIDHRLDPPPPWVAWDHQETGVWPVADEGEGDLNADREPRWLDEIADKTRALLMGFRSPAVIGHVDWESQNIRWHDGQPRVVHDWDSAAARPEATIAGAASAVFTVTGDPPTAATIAETERFLDAYQQARRRSFAPEELKAAWAAGLWVKAFKAKKTRVHRRAETEAFADEARELLRRATV